jgi:hypothetical protein
MPEVSDLPDKHADAIYDLLFWQRSSHISNNRAFLAGID